MRLLSLTFAFGVLISGSVANADFIIAGSRTPNAFTIGVNSFDVVRYSVINDGVNGSGTNVNVIDLAMYDSTGGGKNGMLISATNTADGSDGNAQVVLGTVNPAEGYPDIFDQFGEASLAHSSWLANLGGAAVFAGSSVVTFFGGAFTKDQAAPSTAFANTYTDLHLVGGIAGFELWTSAGVIASSGVFFAQSAVLHGDSVTLVVPTSDGRIVPSITWETAGTGFGTPSETGIFPNVSGTYSDLLPEPSSAAGLSLAAIALLARRRHVN